MFEECDSPVAVKSSKRKQKELLVDIKDKQRMEWKLKRLIRNTELSILLSVSQSNIDLDTLRLGLIKPKEFKVYLNKYFKHGICIGSVNPLSMEHCEALRSTVFNHMALRLGSNPQEVANLFRLFCFHQLKIAYLRDLDVKLCGNATDGIQFLKCWLAWKTPEKGFLFVWYYYPNQKKVLFFCSTLEEFKEFQKNLHHTNNLARHFIDWIMAKSLTPVQYQDKHPAWLRKHPKLVREKQAAHPKQDSTLWRGQKNFFIQPGQPSKFHIEEKYFMVPSGKGYTTYKKCRANPPSPLV